jgi:hypothetical protein
MLRLLKILVVLALSAAPVCGFSIVNRCTACQQACQFARRTLQLPS